MRHLIDLVETLTNGAVEMKQEFNRWLNKFNQQFGPVWVDLVVSGKNNISLESIVSETKKQGFANTVMNQLCDLADKNHVSMTLQPVSFAQQGDEEHSEGLHMDDLIMWYEKFGFDMDYETGLMHRSVDLSESRDGDQYFELNDLDDVRNYKSRATLVYMSPTDFLAMAKEGHDSGKARKVIDLVKKGAKFNSTPLLSFEHDGKGLATVVGHEGRHRARVLQALGVKEMPVVLNSISSNEGNAIRWGSQQDNSIDKIRVMPTRLRGQDHRAIIPMPRSVIFEAQIIPFGRKPMPDEETKAFLARPVQELTLADTMPELRKAQAMWNRADDRQKTQFELAQHHQVKGNPRLVARYLKRFYEL